MSRIKRPAIEGHLSRLAKEGRKVFAPFLTAGLPSPQRFVELAGDLAGVADVIEVGFPFSDPIMDGPVIQEASTRALAQGVSVKGCFSLIRDGLVNSGIPAVAMTYYNLIHYSGRPEFVEALERSGAGGLIVPDLPVEEGKELSKLLSGKGIALVQLIAPTTPEDRVALLAKSASGFVYAVARVGVTGEQDRLDEVAAPLVERIKRHTDLPVLLGIGISNETQAAQAAKIADGVIIGSALMKMLLKDDLAGALKFSRQIRASLDKV